MALQEEGRGCGWEERHSVFLAQVCHLGPCQHDHLQKS